MRAVSSWGRLSAQPHAVVALSDPGEAARVVRRSQKPGLPFGAGRSYGDVCLNPGQVLWDTRGLDHFRRFDPATGVLECEAGVLLRDIQRVFAPRGWMLPVTPGTELVTVGGAIANDVHGKNHHVHGSFGNHVERITVLRTDGEMIDCAPAERGEWFAATVGGMGLTGIILQATLRLRRVQGPWLATETVPFESIDEFFDVDAASSGGWEHTVAWLDCLSARGRGLFMRGTPSAAGGAGLPTARELSVPVGPPFSLVNRFTLRPFNSAYYHLKRRKARSVEHYSRFLYPLDGLTNWNLMYGPSGFYQYQCLFPAGAAADGIKDLLAQIASAGEGSFLAVLKRFGERSPVGLMSFPAPGVTLALDFPNRGATTLRLFDRLDAVVRAAAGRLYVAKDARMPRDLFEASYPRLREFLPYRDAGISSALSRRLLGS